MDDDSRRWQEAEAMLRGDDEHLRDAIACKRTQTLLVLGVVLGVLIVGSVVAIAVLLLVGRHEGHVHHDQATPVWAGVLGVAFLVAGVLVMAAGIWQSVRAGVYRGRWNAPTSRLTTAQHRHLSRQVQQQDRREPVDLDHLGLTQYVAGRMIAQRWAMLVPAGAVLSQVSSAIAQPTLWRLLYLGLMAAFLGVLAIFMARRVHRARVFLDRHPVPA